MGAPQIVDHDPAWAGLAAAELAAIGAVAGTEDARLEHIGSTSVPGLAAKPILDLQLTAPTLPDEAELTAALAPLGYTRARGSRPDSPGVDVDIPRPGTDPDPALHAKLLFHRAAGAGPEVILHVRRADSPFAAFVIAFRDWLRSDPALLDRYASLKRGLAARFADAPDYDDYTRAKSGFMDAAQAEKSWPR